MWSLPQPCDTCPRRNEPRSDSLDDPRGKWCATARGPSDAPLAIIGIAPGKRELVNEEGVGPRPFVATSATILRAGLASGGLSLEQCFATNVVSCYPMGMYDTLAPEQVVACSKRFYHTLRSISPRVLLLLGNEPLDAACQFTGKKMHISHWDGYLIRRDDLSEEALRRIPPSVEWIVATYHPAYIARTGNRKFPWFRRMVVRAARATRGELNIATPPNTNSDAATLPNALSPALDLEVDYRGSGRITLVGLAWSHDGTRHALSVPMDARGMWLTETALYRPEINIFNANYDIPVLIDARLLTMDRMLGLKLVDPMWAGALLEPDAPGYTLNQLFAAFCDGFRWKHKGLPGMAPRHAQCKPHKMEKVCSYCSIPTTIWHNPEKGKRRCQTCSDIAFGVAKTQHDKAEVIYNRQDAFNLLPLWQAMRGELIRNGQLELFEHEMRVLPMLIQLHLNGLRIDTAVRDRLALIYCKWADRAETQWTATAGEINLRSPQQLKKLLYEDWQLPIQYNDVKEGGQMVKKVTTNKEAIQTLARIAGERALSSSDSVLRESLLAKRKALVALIHARHRKKFLATYLQIGDTIYPSYAPGSKDDVEKGRAFVVSASTGRIVAKGHDDFRGVKTPPIQQMPKPLRLMVVPEQPENVFVATDYDSQELRIAAALSGDPMLLSQIARQDRGELGEDGRPYNIHDDNARRLGVDRTRAKNAFYGGALFGGSWKAILEAFHAAGYTHVEARDAKEILAMFRSLYTRHFVWQRELVREADLNGYLEDGFHRRRYFPEIRSNFNEIVNFKVQASGAGIQWTIMPLVYNLCREYNGWLRIPMHDEVVCEVHPDTLEEFVPRKHAIMTQPFNQIAPGFTCPVETKVGRRWKMNKDAVWIAGTYATG